MLVVEMCQFCKLDEALDNLTPADIFFGRQKEVLSKREEIKTRTLQKRRLQIVQASVSV